MTSIVYKDFPRGPASTPETRQIANIILSDHFDKVQCDNPRHPNPLVNKAFEIVEGMGFNADEEYRVSLEEYRCPTETTKVRFHFSRDKKFIVNGFEIYALPDFEEGPVEPFITYEPQNMICNLGEFIDNHLKLGVRESLQTTRKPKVA